MRASGLSKSTVHRLDTGQELGESALRAVSRAVGWTADSAAKVLAGGEPTEADPAGVPESDLEARYQRRPIADGQITQVFEDALYQALLVAAPDTPLSQIDRARQAAFDVLRANGIAVARRHPEESEGTDTDS